MPYIPDIATAIPPFALSNQDVFKFYSKVLEHKGAHNLIDKLQGIITHSKISNRYSCLPDFYSKTYELFAPDNYEPFVDERLRLFREKIVPLSIKVIDQLLFRTHVAAKQITHIITVTCTGLIAPGLEFHLAEHYKLHHAEKLSLNFLGCYAALKAIQQANHIATANPNACILIVCAELSSLHFNTSTSMEDIIANLLFSDGAAALLVCGNKSPIHANRPCYQIDNIGGVSIPGTLDQMKWSVTATSFRMYLSREIVSSLRTNIKSAIDDFLDGEESDFDYWAIHPGGIRIVEAVQDALQLSDEKINDSLAVLRNYGNMSSPTILFIIKNIFTKIGMSRKATNKIFSCAFGPGLNVEMMQLSPLIKSGTSRKKTSMYVTQEQNI